MMTIRSWRSFACIALPLLCAPLAARASEWGAFSGMPNVDLLDDGRKMKLREPFWYKDPAGKTWTAPAESVVDGASIPRAFWAIIGPPLVGPYRNASIIHDVGCVERKDSWRDVHRTFYNAMRCGGVGETKAKIMYYAVYHFGPRWGVGVSIAKFCSSIGLNDENRRQIVDESQASQIAAWIEQANPRLEELETRKPLPAAIGNSR